MLYRGVSSASAAACRAARLVTVLSSSSGASGTTATPTERAAPPGPTSVLGIDGHNVLLTVANYLHGIPTFECDDGLIRDIGGIHGRVRDETMMHRAINLFAESIASIMSVVSNTADPSVTSFIGDSATTLVYLDAPVSHSREHAGYLRRALKEHSVSSEVAVVPSADAALRAEATPHAASVTLLATSDSVLIDTTTVPVFDLARYVIEHHFSPAFESFRTILPLSK